jgi:hypothetical protein
MTMTNSLPRVVPTDKYIDEVARAVHIEWLSRAKTAKIDGSEMTVLPYGYLSQAVKETLLAYRTHLKEELWREIRENVEEYKDKLFLLATEGKPEKHANKMQGVWACNDILAVINRVMK